MIIAVVVFFTLNGDKQEKSKSELVEVDLVNGENIQLTKEEFSLILNENEKKVILTEFGMT
jgi:hypothetical protein